MLKVFMCIQNCELILNDISFPKDIQLDGSMLQTGGHDFYEYSDAKGLSMHWEGCQALSQADCPVMSGCSWSGGQCTGYPSDPESQKPSNVFGVVPEEYVFTDDSPKPRHGVMYRYNWVHDTQNLRTSKRGLRFDRAQHICNGEFGNTWPSHCEMSRNVAWRTAGNTVKGSHNLVSRNTLMKTGGGTHGGGVPIFDDEGFDFSKVFDLSVYDEESEGTCTCTGKGTSGLNAQAKMYCQEQNNTCCVPGRDSTFEGRGTRISKNGFERFYGLVGGGENEPSTTDVDEHYPVPMQQHVSGNSAGVLYEELHDPENLDFRPRAGLFWAQNAIGAYDAAEPGTEQEYWIPGRQKYRASRPIPMDNATDISLTADLMWLPGRTRSSFPKAHRVFVACSEQELQQMADEDLDITALDKDLQCTCKDNTIPPMPGVAGTQIDKDCPAGQRYFCPNVFAVPPDLRRRNRRIYWRVDSIMQASGADNLLVVVPGEVWSFKFKPFPGAELEPIVCGSNDDCVSRYDPLPAHLDTPLPSSKQSKYVTGLAPITIDDRYSAKDLSNGAAVYRLKSVKVCLSLVYSEGVNTLGIRFHSSARTQAVPLFLQGYCKGQCDNFNGQAYSSLKELQNVCFEDGNNNGGLTVSDPAATTVTGVFAPRYSQTDPLSLKDLLLIEDGRNLSLGQVSGEVSLSAQVPGRREDNVDIAVTDGIGSIKSWYVELEFEGGDQSLVDQWHQQEAQRLSEVAQDSALPWCGSSTAALPSSTSVSSSSTPLPSPVSGGSGCESTPIYSKSGGLVFFVDCGDGSDADGDGSLCHPFKTVQVCVYRLRGLDPSGTAVGGMTQAPAGSECRLREGVCSMEHDVHGNDNYILIEHLEGEQGKPFIIGAWNDEKVLFKGTLDVHPNCEKGVDGPWHETLPNLAGGGAGSVHWRTTLPDSIPDPWQLFVGEKGEDEGEMFVNARWPDGKFNGLWDENSVDGMTMFRAKSWKHGSGEKDQQGNYLSYFINEVGAESRMVDRDEEPRLSESGINATGASAILNIGHWKTFTTTVKHHSPGSSSFTYMKKRRWGTPKYSADHDLFYLENKLQFLDTETEWFYDKYDRSLHVKTRGDVHPCDLRVQVRVQTYAFRIVQSKYVAIQNLRFFGTTLWTSYLGNQQPAGVVYDSLIFRFPHAQKRMLGDHDFVAPTTLDNREKDAWCENMIVNCTFFGSECDPVVAISGAGFVLDNNEFMWNDWTGISATKCRPQDMSKLQSDESFLGRMPDLCDDSGSGSYGGAFALDVGSGTIAYPATVRRNTIGYFGPSAGINLGRNGLIELNDVHHPMDIQMDGAMCQSGGHDLIEVANGAKSKEWKPLVCDERFNDETGNQVDCENVDGCLWNDLDGKPNQGRITQLPDCSGFPTSVEGPPNDYFTSPAYIPSDRGGEDPFGIVRYGIKYR